MKVIFLDIDGVLNGYNKFNMVGEKICKTLHMEKLYEKINNPFYIRENKVKILSKIIKQTNAKVVMSSSWRHHYWNTPYEEKSIEQKRLYDLFHKYNIDVIDITPTTINHKRSVEIINWLAQNEEQIEKFIIIDDEPRELSCFVGSELIQTSTIKPTQIIKGHYSENTGLKKKHIKEAIEKLK